MIFSFSNVRHLERNSFFFLVTIEASLSGVKAIFILAEGKQETTLHNLYWDKMTFLIELHIMLYWTNVSNRGQQLAQEPWLTALS